MSIGTRKVLHASGDIPEDQDSDLISHEFGAKRLVRGEEVLTHDHWYDGLVRLFYWYPPKMPRKEKFFVLKLDIIILFYICLSYFTKSLDKANLQKAYNSGFKELFKHDDLAYANSLYTAGYVVSMCFGTMLVTRKWAKFMLPVLETVWGVLTFCEAAVTTASQMFALRFLIGMAEGPIFPSIAYILGSWYKRDELYRRIMAFSVSSSIGGLISGPLQTAANNRLAGKGGISGWQWGFIIDGVFTVPVALLGFFIFPGTLEQSTKSWWLSKEDHELADTRMAVSGVRPSHKFSWNIIKRIFFRWHVHYFTAYWVMLDVTAQPGQSSFDLWLLDQHERHYGLSSYKGQPESSAHDYSTSDVNNYPSIQSAVGIVVQFIFAGLADTYPDYIFSTITQALFVVSFSSLAAWNIPDGFRWFCYLVMSLSGVNQAIVTAQINRACRRDAEERAFVLAFTDAFSHVMYIWTNIVFYPTSKAPGFHLGFIMSDVAAIIMLLLPIFLWLGRRYDETKYVRDVEADESDLPAELQFNGNDKDLEVIATEELK